MKLNNNDLATIVGGLFIIFFGLFAFFNESGFIRIFGIIATLITILLIAGILLKVGD